MGKTIFISKSTPDVITWITGIFSISVILALHPIFRLTGIYESGTITLNVTGLCIIAIICELLYTPYRYTLSDTHLVINRHFGNIEIPLEQISEIRLFTDADRREFTLTGYTRRSKKYKNIRYYSRRRNQWIFVVTGTAKYIIGPDDNIRMLSAVQKQLSKVNPNFPTVETEDIIFVSKSTQDAGFLLRTAFLIFLPVATFLALGLIFNILIALIALLPVLFLIMGIINKPYGYVLSNIHLHIKRHNGDIVIPLEQIYEIRLFTTTDFNLGKIAGLYGYLTGYHDKIKIYSRRYSNWLFIIVHKQSQVYTRRNKWTPIVIQKKYVIAPDNINLLDEVKAQIARNNIPAGQSEIVESLFYEDENK
ncbi:MAG: PH domain-containing protein [Prevotellaceae bacterium]|jgi:hypothetical protein|nr:PH domain-containing protein [Prevotellaceae bacterium]